MRITALVVDNEMVVRREIIRFLSKAALLQNDRLILKQAETAIGAMHIIKNQSVDFAVVDFDLGAGLNGIQLSMKLLTTYLNLQICIFSGYEESVIDPLRAAFCDSEHVVQYRAKPVSGGEWANIYQQIRKNLLGQRQEFLFEDLQNMYRRAMSMHERLRILNLISERAIRMFIALTAPMFPISLQKFLTANTNKRFITASALYDFAEELAEAYVQGHDKIDTGAIVYLAGALSHNVLASARFILTRENELKHRTHTGEIELRALFNENRDVVNHVLEFVAGFRAMKFFHKEFDSEYCNNIVCFGTSRPTIESLAAEPQLLSLASGVILENHYFDISPVMIIDKCCDCSRHHIFNLQRITEEAKYYVGQCSRKAKKVIPLRGVKRGARKQSLNSVKRSRKSVGASD